MIMLTLGVRCTVRQMIQGGKVANVGDDARGCGRGGERYGYGDGRCDGLRRMGVREASGWGIKMGRIGGLCGWLRRKITVKAAFASGHVEAFNRGSVAG
jgi:hypothetical protein